MITRRTWMNATLAGCAGFLSCSQPVETTKEASQTKTAAAEEFPRYDPEALKQRLDAGEDVFLLDVRRPEELEEIGTIEGYHHIPIDELEARMSEVPKDRPLVVY